MKTIINILTLCTLVSLMGCVNMRSNVEREAVPSFKRILVVTKTRLVQDRYAQSFVKVFPANYEVCIMALSQLDFSNDERVRKQADLCKSDVVLTVDVTYSANLIPWTPNGAGMSQVNLEMKSLRTNQPFWRAIVSMDPIHGEQMPARTIARRLQKDGIITGHLPEDYKEIAQRTEGR